MEMGLILERELTTFRPTGGTISECEIHQSADGKWYVNVQLSWHGLALFHVGYYDKKQIRLYAKVSSAIRHIVRTYDYDGLIAVHPHPQVRDATRF